MNAVFGLPSAGGNVHVRNFDATIPDRAAVTGGLYLPDNGSGEQEIRFPIYSNDEAAAVNFVHCLLLAYYGPNAYAFDAFREGIVRAAVMRVVRTPGAMPAPLDPALIESVLDNTYDTGAWYDPYNQRALGGERFVAPNLVNENLPAGGSVGGLYLLRFQMAGSAWQKVLTEYPGFLVQFNQQAYAQPALLGDVPGLVTLAQQVLDALAGSANAPIEGRVFEDWFERQFVLETKTTTGQKLLVQPVPIPPVSGSSDFGVFDVVAHWFETTSAGTEILLSGVSYPIFWTDVYDRFFPSTQEDRMDIAGAYGSVTPNMSNFYNGQPYCATIEIPVQDKLTRCHVPSGAIATGQNTTENDFYGTVIGFPVGASLRVRLTYGLTTVDGIAVINGAFKARINTADYLGYSKLLVEVIRTFGPTETVVISRNVNKGPGPLALDLRPDHGDATFALGTVPKGLSTIGLSLDPHASYVPDVLGTPLANTLVARWNGIRVRYDIWPDTGTMKNGEGYFVRLDSATPITLAGRKNPGTPHSVALRPGWNLIANPLTEDAPTTSVLVLRAANLAKDYADAVGTEIGTVFFEFQPGPPDAATGAPETGTMIAATSFEAGKAYFVRVLVPEGVTLNFRPTPPGRPATPTAPPKFKMGIKVAADGHWAESLIGQAVGATAGFDRVFDSGLPPGVGGLQSHISGPEALHTDMRTNATGSIYKFEVQGLIPNKSYTLSTRLINGTWKRYRWRRAGQTSWSSSTGPLNFIFRSNDSVVRLEFKLEARP